MAGTITKNLKLKASLDDQQLKQQLAELKKQFGDVQIGGNNLKDFDKSIKSLSDAAASLKQAIGDMKRGMGTTGGGGPRQGFGGPHERVKMAKGISGITEEITKNASKKIKEYFDAQNAKYVKLKPGEVYDQGMKRKFKSDDDAAKGRAEFENRESRKQQDADFKTSEKKMKFEAKEREKQRKADVSNAKDALAAILSRTGMGLPMARQVAGVVGNAAPGMFGRIGAGVRGMGAGIGGALATPAGMIGGGLLAGGAIAAYGYMNHMSRSRDFRTAEARERQEVGFSVLENRAMEGEILKRGRGRIGALEGTLAATGGLLSAFNPFSENFASSPTKAGENSIRAREEAEQKAMLAETELGRASIGKARALREGKIGAMRGGDITSGQISGNMMLGSMQGFSQEETIQQLNSIKKFIGKESGISLPGMQRRMNMTGIGVEDQASAMDMMMGTRKGMSSGVAFDKSFDIVKKGVAAGLDVSKSGQFLKMTSEYISGNQGLGQIDADAIGTRLAESARAFAGGGSITSTHMDQARQLQEQLRTESTASGGFAGLGNMMGMMDAMGGKMSPGQMMAGMGLSNNATVEDIMKSLNVDEATAKKIQGSKSNNLDTGLGALGNIDPSLKLALMAGETGQTTEQALGRQSATGFKGGGLDVAGAGAKLEENEFAMRTDEDMKSVIADFKASQIAVTQGMAAMSKETEVATKNLSRFSSEMARSIRTMLRYSNGSMDNEGQ